MQQYIDIKLRPTRPGLSLGILGEPLQDWQYKARTLRSRREQLLQQRLASHAPKPL